MANHPCILGYGTLEEQVFRVFKKRMVYYASFDNGYFDHRTKEYKRPLHWFELAKEKWTRVYKTPARLAVVCCAKGKSMTDWSISGKRAD